jgi:hypothetical protein
MRSDSVMGGQTGIRAEQRVTPVLTCLYFELSREDVLVWNTSGSLCGESSADYSYGVEEMELE